MQYKSRGRAARLTPSPPFGRMDCMDEKRKQFGLTFWLALTVILTIIYLLARPAVH